MSAAALVAVNALMGILAWRVRAVTIGGATAGAAIASLVTLAFGWGFWLLLGTGLGATIASTRLGYTRKRRAGIAESRAGRRAAANVVANTGVAGLAAGTSLTLAGLTDGVAAVAAVAAITSGVSDTVATEIGQVRGGRPRLLPWFTPVAPGTPGAVSASGTAAAGVAALCLAALGAAAGVVEPGTVVPIAGSALAASLIEGLVARTIEARGWIGNDTVNLINTLAGAAMAVVACQALGLL